MKRKRRSPFLLVEVLMALTLVTLCLIPLSLPHRVAAEEEIALWEEAQLRAHAQKAFAAIARFLHEETLKGEHSKIQWEELMKGAIALPHTMRYPVHYPKNTLRYFSPICTLSAEQKRINPQDGRAVALLEIAVQFNGSNKKNPPYTFSYEMVAYRGIDPEEGGEGA